MTHDLVRAALPVACWRNPALEQGDDAAVLALPEGTGRLAFTTDAHIVAPLFFPGGDIGRLAVCGTVNDLAVMGARPLWLTASFILEEGLPLATLDRVIESMRAAAEEAGVHDRRRRHQGRRARQGRRTVHHHRGRRLGAGRDAMPAGGTARPGDVVLVSGPVGDHGIAVLEARGELGLASDIRSDVAPSGRAGGGAVLPPAAGCTCCAIRRAAAWRRRSTRSPGRARVGIELQETAIPVRPAVQAACELLGIDPLYVANEGKLVAIVEAAEADAALAALRGTRYGEEACAIGRVLPEPEGGC